MAQWWERSPPTNVSRVRFPDPASYVGWVCCWFSPLFRGFFSGFTGFLPPQKPTFLNSNSIGNSRATSLSVEHCCVSPSLNKVDWLIDWLIIEVIVTVVRHKTKVITGQSQRTWAIQWTSYNSQQTRVADGEYGRTCASTTKLWVNFFSQSLSIVKQNQSKHGELSTLKWKPLFRNQSKTQAVDRV